MAARILLAAVCRLVAASEDACVAYGENLYYDAVQQTDRPEGTPCCAGLVQCNEPDPNNLNNVNGRWVCLTPGCTRPPFAPPPPPPSPPLPAPPAYLRWLMNDLELRFSSSDCMPHHETPVASPSAPLVKLPDYGCHVDYAWSSWTIYSLVANEYHGSITINQDGRKQITEVTYAGNSLFCVNAFASPFTPSMVNLSGVKESPCGCVEQPPIGTPGPEIDTDCFIPSDTNYDPAAGRPPLADSTRRPPSPSRTRTRSTPRPGLPLAPHVSLATQPRHLCLAPARQHLATPTSKDGVWSPRRSDHLRRLRRRAQALRVPNQRLGVARRHRHRPVV